MTDDGLLTLQVNNTGAWKNVCSARAEHLDQVKRAAADLGAVDALSGGRMTLRVVRGADRVVCHWSVKSGWADWLPPHQRPGTQPDLPHVPARHAQR